MQSWDRDEERNRSKLRSLGNTHFRSCTLHLGIARLNACLGGLGHLFREELSKFKWAYPCFWGALNACPDGLEHLFTATTMILRFFSNWSQSAQPSPAPECPVEWEGSNRYLGNAQMDCESTNMGLP